MRIGCGIILRVWCLALTVATAAVAAQPAVSVTLPWRDAALPGPPFSQDGDTTSGWAFVDYFPNGDRLLRYYEVRTVRDSDGQVRYSGLLRYERQAPDGTRRELLSFLSPDRSGDGAGWPPPAVESLSPSGRYALCVASRSVMAGEERRRVRYSGVLDWQTGETTTLPSNLEAVAWVDDRRVACIDRTDVNAIDGTATELHIWDLGSQCVDDRISLPQGLILAQHVHNGVLALQLLPPFDASDDYNRPFWNRAILWYLVRQLQNPIVESGVSHAVATDPVAPDAPADGAGRSFAQWSLTINRNEGAFRADPAFLETRKLPLGTLWLLRVAPGSAADWRLLAADVPLGHNVVVSPNGRFVAAAPAQPGDPPGEHPLVIFDSLTRRWVRVDQLPVAGVRTLRWLPDGHTLRLCTRVGHADDRPGPVEVDAAAILEAIVQSDSGR